MGEYSCIMNENKSSASVEKANKGDLLIGLCYQPIAKKLIVKVKQGRNLVKTGLIGKSDPYVKIALWKDEKLVVEDKTNIQNDTQNPVFNKTVFMDLPEVDKDVGLKSIKVEFTVFDNDFGKDDVIGHLFIGGKKCTGKPLEHWNQVETDPLKEIEVWHQLHEPDTKTIQVDEQIKGDLQVGMFYQPIAKKLFVKVKQAKNLVKTGLIGKSDPYVKLALWQGKELLTEAKTDIQRNTQNPVYNENVVFDLPELEKDIGMKNIKVEFLVLDDDVGKDDVIGKLIIGGLECVGTALEQWKKVTENPLDEFDAWHQLSKSGLTTFNRTNQIIENKAMKGELLIGLCYQPTAKKIIINIDQARRLVKTSLVGKPDPYVKMALWHGDKLIQKAKTTTQKDTQDPVFNTSHFFDIPELDKNDGLKKIQIEFTVWDEDIGNDDVIGQLVIGGEKRVGTSKEHWTQVIASPLKEIKAWHQLSQAGISSH